eukprot:Nk52_evm7s1607 gene=Nk52_evmTU7s1607
MRERGINFDSYTSLNASHYLKAILQLLTKGTNYNTLALYSVPYGIHLLNSSAHMMKKQRILGIEEEDTKRGFSSYPCQTEPPSLVQDIRSDVTIAGLKFKDNHEG